MRDATELQLEDGELGLVEVACDNVRGAGHEVIKDWRKRREKQDRENIANDAK